MKHIRSKHPHMPFLYKCEPCNQVFLFKMLDLQNVRIEFLDSLVILATGIYLHRIPTYQAFPIGASTVPTSLLWILQASIWQVSRLSNCKYPIIGFIFDNCNPHIYLNTLMKHNKSKHHSLQVFNSKTPASSVIAQMDASNLNSRRDDDDDCDTNVNGWGSPKDVRPRDCDAQADPTSAENVGVLTLLPRSSTRNCYI